MSSTPLSAASRRTAATSCYRRQTQDDSEVATSESVAVVKAHDWRSSGCLDETTSCCRIARSSRLNCSKTVRCRPQVYDSLTPSPVTVMISVNKHDTDSDNEIDAEPTRVTFNRRVTALRRTETRWRARGHSSIDDVSDVWSSNLHADPRIAGDAGNSVAGGRDVSTSLVARSSRTVLGDITITMTTNWHNKHADIIDDVTASFERSSCPPLVRRKRTNSMSGCDDVADERLTAKRPMRHAIRLSISDTGDRLQNVPRARRRRRVDTVNSYEHRQMATAETETDNRCLCSTSGLSSDVIDSDCTAAEFDQSDRRAQFSIRTPTTSGVAAHNDSRCAARNNLSITIESTSVCRCRRNHNECHDCPTSSTLDAGPQLVLGDRRRHHANSDKMIDKFNCWFTAAILLQCVSLLVGPAHCSARHLQSSPLLPPSSSVSSLSSSSSSASSSSSSSLSSLGLSPTAGQQRQAASRNRVDTGSLVNPDAAIGLRGSVPGRGGRTGSGGRSPRTDSGSSLMMGDGPGLPCIYEGHIKSDR